MARIKFLRRNTPQYLRLGRKKLQKWRRPTGRHNKMRKRRKGYPRNVEIGFKKNKNMQGKIRGKIPLIIENLKQAEKLTGSESVIIGKIGRKKKIEIARKLKEKKLSALNLNVEKFLAENEFKKPIKAEGGK